MAEENGAEEVVAEVIEEQGAPDLVVTYSPSVISANFDAMEDSIRAKVADYEGAKYDLTKDESIKEAKNDRLYLNGLKKEIEERRKAVKREYNKPLAAFEKRCKEITSIIDGASDGIKAQLDQAEEDRKSRAMARLKEHYETFAELLAPVVPYERIHEKQWLNKGFGEVKAKKALEAKVSAVARDWDTLKAQRDSMAHYEVAERELFRTLDLGSALNAARAADEEDARIAAMREAVTGGLRKPDGAPAWPKPAPEARQAHPELSCAWTVEIPSATRSQMELLAAALRERGITGTIKCKGVR
ncbi:DUF1351 domain-containing protein [Gordonibacter urolithinfaciens]|uniref:DUF1351 domain-containing protein n=1 Tax=Gordonibacter urolithinfaciens TaxID=1335613 RepID=UPI003A954E75